MEYSSSSLSLYRRVDDLQFQLEEQAIISHDELEAASLQGKEELTKLKTDLQQEKEKSSSLSEQVCSSQTEAQTIHQTIRPYTETLHIIVLFCSSSNNNNTF